MELKLQREYLVQPDHGQTQPPGSNPTETESTTQATSSGEQTAATSARIELLIISIDGELDTNSAGQLENSLSEEWDRGMKLLILELSSMDYVSSVGLRVLLSHLKKLKTCQGRMVLTGLNEEVQEIFDMAGFSALFDIVPDLESARRLLRP